MTARVLMYRTAQCPYCHRAEALLKARGVSEIDTVRIDLDPARRDEMIERFQLDPTLKTSKRTP